MYGVITITHSDYTKPWIGWQRRQGELASRQENLGWLIPRYGLRMRSAHSNRGVRENRVVPIQQMAIIPSAESQNQWGVAEFAANTD